MKKIVLLIIDSLGIGYMDDVEEVRPQDIGANTFKHILDEVAEIKLPNLEKLGIMNALGEEVGEMKFSKYATFGRAKLAHIGADSFFGHNEIIGANVSEHVEAPFSFYIENVYKNLISEGYRVKYCGSDLKYLVVNEEIIIADNIEAEFGNVYSVIGSLKEVDFNEICKVGNILRKIVKVSRIVSVGCSIEIKELIASIEKKENIFIGINASKCNLYNRGYKVQHKGYKINDNNHVLNRISDRRLDVTLIGKAADIIEGEKVKKIHGIDTEFIMKEILREMNTIKGGVIAANIQETDSAGHLQDVKLYAKILKVVDEYLEKIIDKLKEDDLLIVTADHGNDPTIGHSKHTREKVPILIYGRKVESGFIGDRETLGDIGSYIENSLSII